MADNVAITQGAGTDIAADEIAAVKYQRIKMVLGGDGVNDGDVASGNPMPVAGTVTAELSATDNAVLDALVVDTGEIQTAVEAINTKLASGTVIGDVNLGATDNAVLDAIEADTTSIDGKLPVLGQALAAASIPVVLPAAQITTLTPPAAITGFATAANQTTIIGHVDGIETVLGTIDADTGAIKTAVEAIQAAQLPDSHNVTVDNASLAVTGTFWQATQPVSASSLPLPTGAATSANQTTIIGHVDGIEGLLTTIDADTSALAGAVSGTEVQVDVVGALPAGTNAIGKLLPPDVDVTAHTNYAKKYYTSAGAATDGIIWSPAAGKRWHVVSLYIQVSAAATVTLEDDKAAGDEAVFKSEFAANSGTFLVFPEKYPLASGEDAADLLITTSAGNVYVTVTGYEI